MKKLLLILCLFINSFVYADDKIPILVTGDIFSYKCVEIKFDNLSDLGQEIERVLSAPDTMVMIVPEIRKRYFPTVGDRLPDKITGKADTIFSGEKILLITVTNYNVKKTVRYKRVYLDLIINPGILNKAILIYRRDRQ